MNHGFKLKYNEMQENNPAHKEGEEKAAKVYDDKYAEPGHVRNLCFVWLDGKRTFLNYSYLMSGEYSPEENTIQLMFTTHAVVLKGVNLGELFYDVMSQMARQIVCTDARYNIIGVSENPVVNEINMTDTTT